METLWAQSMTTYGAQQWKHYENTYMHFGHKSRSQAGTSDPETEVNELSKERSRPPDLTVQVTVTRARTPNLAPNPNPTPSPTPAPNPNPNQVRVQLADALERGESGGVFTWSGGAEARYLGET